MTDVKPNGLVQQRGRLLLLRVIRWSNDLVSHGFVVLHWSDRDMSQAVAKASPCGIAPSVGVALEVQVGLSICDVQAGVRRTPPLGE
jgi:hypothetical protein